MVTCAADLHVALRALDAQVNAMERREGELDRVGADQDERQALLERYYAWLRTVPVAGGGGACRLGALCVGERSAMRAWSWRERPF